MDYIVVSKRELKAKAIYNLVREFLDDLEGTYIVGKYDMGYLFEKKLEYLFFDYEYFSDYEKMIRQCEKGKVQTLVCIDFGIDKEIEDEKISCITKDSTIEDLKKLLDIKNNENYSFDLSDRDRSILYLLSTGISNKEIGKKLYLSEKTIKNNLTRIYKTLGVNGKFEAIALYHKLKI